MSELNFSSVMINSASTYSSGVTCYLNKNDPASMVLNTTENNLGKVKGLKVYSQKNSTGISFDDVTIERSTKTKIVLVAVGLNGAVVTLALDVDSRGDNHNGVLVIRHFDKTVEEMWVQCVLKN